MSPITTARKAKHPPIRLDPARVNAWRVGRQLLTRERGGAPEDVARQLVGVQAQVTSSAALSIALRSKSVGRRSATLDATARALADRRLVRSWAMRGTLHLFAADDVPTVAAALGRREPWRRPAWLRWFGLTEREMERLIDVIGEILDDGVPRTRAELSVEVGERMGERTGRLLLGSWGSALKIASDHHYLVQSADEAGGVRFVRASRWLDGWRDEDPTAALARIVERYLAAYGPATQREILRWWGLAVVATLRPALETLGDALVEVEVGGVRALARHADVDAIEATRPTRGAVHLLGGFDPLIVGAGLRDGLIPPAHLKRVSRTAGWISPVVLVDGVVAGVWDMAPGRASAALTVELFVNETPTLRAHIDRAADHVGRALDRPVTIGLGRVFMGQTNRKPFKDR